MTETAKPKTETAKPKTNKDGLAPGSVVSADDYAKVMAKHKAKKNG